MDSLVCRMGTNVSVVTISIILDRSLWRNVLRNVLEKQEKPVVVVGVFRSQQQVLMVSVVTVILLFCYNIKYTPLFLIFKIQWRSWSSNIRNQRESFVELGVVPINDLDESLIFLLHIPLKSAEHTCVTIKSSKFQIW